MVHSSIFAVFGFISSLVGHAGDSSIQCLVQKNFEVIWKGRFQLTENSKTQVLKSDDFTFYVTGKKSAKIELEVFFPDLEARSYAEGIAVQDGVKLTQWTRESLLEFSCRE